MLIEFNLEGGREQGEGIENAGDMFEIGFSHNRYVQAGLLALGCDVAGSPVREIVSQLLTDGFCVNYIRISDLIGSCPVYRRKAMRRK